MLFGLGTEEIVAIVVIALIVIGPERLPQYVQKVTEFAKGARKFMAETKAKVEDDLGPEFSDVDWQKLDPRQYDPRKIVREALIEDTILDPQYEAKKAAGLAGAAVAGSAASEVAQPRTLGFDTYTPLSSGQRAPFDDEAT